MAYLEPALYKEFYAITKEQLGNSSVNKWEDYGVIIQKDIFEKIKQFEPINPNGNKNNKGFRITKNGRDTGIFKRITEYEQNNINEDPQNNINQQINMQIPPNNNNIKINLIQNNEINEDEN